MLTELTKDYYSVRNRYIKAYDDLLAQNKNNITDLNHATLSAILTEGLTFWDGKRIDNYAWCIMPNHVHWVFNTREKDNNGQPVYLSDIMESVKKHTAKEINKASDVKAIYGKKRASIPPSEITNICIVPLNIP